MVLSVHTDWWANLFSGFIGAVVGGVISLGIALLVLSRTRAADRDREQEARAHAAARILTEATSTFSWECMEARERDQRSGSGQAQREAAEKAYIAAIMLDQPAPPERPTGKVLAMTMDVVADYSDTYDAIVNQALRRGGMTGYGPQRDQEWLGDRLKEVLDAVRALQR